MAINKVVYGNTTLLDLTNDTVASGKMLQGTTAHAANGSAISGTIITKTSSALSASGSIVTVPSGYYAAQATKAVASATQATPTITVSTAGLITATATQAAGYVAAGSKSVTKQLTAKTAATYTPGTANQTIASGQYLTGVQTIKGDTNLTAANIASGVTIFGITGTHQGGIDVDDIIVIGDYGLCFNNFTVSGNICTSAAGTVSGNTLIAV